MIIETHKLTKRYGKLVAVDGINLAVKKGEIFGLLGPNGAGKTTTISMLATMIDPTAGKASIAGFDVKERQDEVRSIIGMVFQDPTLDTELTAYENLDFHARLYSVPNAGARIREVMEVVELWDRRNDLVKNYSGGMKRRLEIARGLLHWPKVLFLDEPTLGLDPQTRRHIWSYIRKMNQEHGVTILLTTHYMEEADELCDRVAIIDHGRIIAIETPEKLKSRLGETSLLFEVSDPEAFCRLAGRAKCGKHKRVDGSVQVTASNGDKLIPKLVSLAEKSHIKVLGVSMRSSTLEDVFISLTGRTIREEQAGSKDRWAFGRRML